MAQSELHHAQFPGLLLSAKMKMSISAHEKEYFLLTCSNGWTVNQQSFASPGFDFKGLAQFAY